MNADAHARVLKKLLPPGKLWNLLPESVHSRLFLAFGDEFARVDDRGAALIEETDPRTATETLGDWEAMLGLPDLDIETIPSTDAERRLAVTQKFIRRGGQSPAYFIRLAQACGYDSDQHFIVDNYASTVFRYGTSTMGQPLRNQFWAHVWEFHIEVTVGPSLTQAELEAVIRRAAPAHTVVEFTYF